jgi:hypothetical protein
MLLTVSITKNIFNEKESLIEIVSATMGQGRMIQKSLLWWALLKKYLTDFLVQYKMGNLHYSFVADSSSERSPLHEITVQSLSGINSPPTI